MPVTLAVTFDMSSKDIDQPVHDSAAYVASADERAVAGKALRGQIPRHEHDRWKTSKGRANPIDLLRKSDAGRMKELLAIRYGRMLASPFAFYRGSAGIMASDLARTTSTGLKVQACGDCHLMNFGGFVTPERNIIFDMNDFDETSPAPWEWDVKRLVASIVLAARSNNLSEGQGRDCAVTCARSYREHIRKFSRMDPLRVWYTKISDEDFIDSLPKTLRKNVRNRIQKQKPKAVQNWTFPS
jgi:Uncharacterized protein conserved in bacteria (DUF2252)